MDQLSLKLKFKFALVSLPHTQKTEELGEAL